MSSNSQVLMTAFNQWANRPADESFNSLQELHDAVSAQWAASAEADVDLRKIHIESNGARPVLVGEKGTPVEFTHHSFQQFARRVGAPASYLRELPAELVSANLNHGIAALPQGVATNDQTLLLRTDRGFQLRSIVSDSYKRIVNSDITSRLIRLSNEQGWQPAPAAFDGKRGLYAGDRDMFAFLVDNDRRIFESLPGGGLSRGFFVSNSEIGNSRSFKLTMFLYEWICGNHRVVGAQNITEISIPHIGGKAEAKALASISIDLARYAHVGAAEQEAKIQKARVTVLGSTKDEVLDTVFGFKVNGLSRELIGKGYDRAVEREERYGDPHTAWALTGGLTEVATEIPYADERNIVDRAAGKVLERVTL